MRADPVDWTAVIEQARTPRGRVRHDAWASIYDACHQAVRFRVRGMLGPRPRFNVDDLVQEVFLLATQNFGHFAVVDEPLTSLRRWLCTMAHNHVIDCVRREATEPLAHRLRTRELPQRSGEPTAQRLVEQLLDGLTEEDRLLACLRGIEEMSFKEIVPEIVAFRRSQELDGMDAVTEDGVRMRWRRLRDRMLKLAEGSTHEAQAATPQDEEP